MIAVGLNPKWLLTSGNLLQKRFHCFNIPPWEFCHINSYMRVVIFAINGKQASSFKERPAYIYSPSRNIVWRIDSNIARNRPGLISHIIQFLL
jgi:hypothetical protein